MAWGGAAAKTFTNQCKKKKCKEKVLKAKESSPMKEGQRRGEKVNSAQCQQNVQSCGKVYKSGPSVMQSKHSQSSEASIADKRRRGSRSQRGQSVPETLHTQSTDPIQHVHLHSSYSTHACAAFHMPSPWIGLHAHTIHLHSDCKRSKKDTWKKLIPSSIGLRINASFRVFCSLCNPHAHCSH